MSGLEYLKNFIDNLNGSVTECDDNCFYDSSIRTKIYFDSITKYFYIPTPFDEYYSFSNDKAINIINKLPENNDIISALVPRTKVPYKVCQGDINLFDTSDLALCKFDIKYFDSIRINLDNGSTLKGRVIGLYRNNLWFYFVNSIGLQHYGYINHYHTLEDAGIFKYENIISLSEISLDNMRKNMFLYEYDLSNISKGIFVNETNIFIEIKEILGKKIKNLSTFSEKIKYFKTLPLSYQQFLFGEKEKDDQIFIAKIFLEVDLNKNISSPIPQIFDLIDCLVANQE